MEAFETWLEGRSPLGRTADAAMRLVDWGLVGFALTDWLKRRPLLTPLWMPDKRRMGKAPAPQGQRIHRRAVPQARLK